ncbi:maleylpyruvate isomerase family mycothiol-dependent enzyme [Rhodococcus zopfii]|uniref:Maleylpyruvate isomerase family mycothiol-dependent enzyme n=1 Tax=Rhodococcus zopfii TaxID=43772 RepID=A0ABU3WWJ1_9NOCA|nr:maleylpyruvate isomerase family mycothiol-dependent enzyme [Rhodococcus zopfii]
MRCDGSVNTREHIIAERAELVDLLRSLTPEQWAAPSLCQGWSVRDVVGHLSIDAVPMHRYLLAGLRNPSVDRLNRHYVEAARDVPAGRLVDGLATSVSGSWFLRFFPQLTLADHVVHQQDIRRPLGLPRVVDAERPPHGPRPSGSVRPPLPPHPGAAARSHRHGVGARRRSGGPRYRRSTRAGDGGPGRRAGRTGRRRRPRAAVANRTSRSGSHGTRIGSRPGIMLITDRFRYT